MLEELAPSGSFLYGRVEGVFVEEEVGLVRVVQMANRSLIKVWGRFGFFEQHPEIGVYIVIFLFTL